MNRRTLLTTATVLGGHWALTRQAPAVITRDEARPQLPSGLQLGDPLSNQMLLWSRTDRPARLHLEWDTSERFTNPRRVVGPTAQEHADHTVHAELLGLPAGETILCRARFEDLRSPGRFSEPLTARFKTPPTTKRDLRFLWGGDTVGQGWGIDLSRGGMRVYEAMRRQTPDFFIHSGDLIYADGPVPAEQKWTDGTLWRSLTTEAKSKVAETLDEFRGNYRYNLMDENLRRFNAEVPQLIQWDDHETRNNWYPSQILEDPRYKETSVNLLSARAKQAVFDYTPLRRNPLDPDRVFRSYSYGKGVEVFLLDERSYRGANSPNRQTTDGPESAFLGAAQLEWLMGKLKASKAVWKILASDMPLSLVVGDGPQNFEAFANGENGVPSGRERELARLLKFLKDNRIHNTVWVTADVHYAAAHHYDPKRAQLTDFLPFWEFVAGPLHAGGFGPGKLDATFGPEQVFATVKPGAPSNRPPLPEYCWFGQVDFDSKTDALTVGILDGNGKTLYSVVLPPTR